MHTQFRLFLNKEKLKAVFVKQKNYWQPKLLLQSPVFIIGLFIFSLTPFLFALFLIKMRFTELRKNKVHFEQIQLRSRRLAQTQKSRNEFLEKYQQSDPYYVKSAVQEMAFLQPEVDVLKIIYEHPAFQSCPAIKQRLTHLTQGGNRLAFTEKKREASKLIEEIYYMQQTPIEVNTEDIKHILSVFEGISIGSYEPSPLRPQLVVYCFDLERKSLLERENYFLEMNIIKRNPI